MNCPKIRKDAPDAEHEAIMEVIRHDIGHGLQPFLYAGIAPDNPNLPNDPIATIQFTGLAVYLYDDGTWEWEDTTGG